MGYSTNYEGELKFTSMLTGEELAFFNSIAGENIADHDEWEYPEGIYLNYIDLELLRDFSGIKWSGAEKSNDMHEQVNVVLREMKKKFPEFGLEGELKAQGEDADDRWMLRFDDQGWAIRVEDPHPGKKIFCPHCATSFYLGEE